MTVHSVPLLALSLLSCAVFADVPAAPPTGLKPVEVTTRAPDQTVRVDIRSACPSIDRTLQAALANTLQRHGTFGSTRVDFRVEGDRVTKVSMRGAPWDYRSDIRRAMSRLDCVATEAGAQNYAFSLVFLDPSDVPEAAQRYALVAP